MQRDIKMNGRPLSSSYVMPPMATEGTETGEVTEAMIRYYEKMVKNPNFGLFILEHAFVEERGKALNTFFSSITPALRPAESIREQILLP